MKDYSYWEVYKGASEGTGRSEKIWLQNPDDGQIGLFKYKKDAHTTDHVSEQISFKLAVLLEIPCAKCEIGIYKGHIGSMSYNIIKDESSRLIEGVDAINNIYPTYNTESFIDKETGSHYSLEMIKEALEPYGLFEEFLFIPIFDYLIGNTDRHQSNWATIEKDKIITICPLYDNSSSLCAYLTEDKVIAYLGKDKLMWNSLVNTKSKSMIRLYKSDDTRPTHNEVIEFLKNQYFDETVSLIYKITEKLEKNKLKTLLDDVEQSVMSLQRKELIIKFICSKIQILRGIYFGKEEQDGD